MPLIVDTYNVLHVVGVLPPEIAGIDTAELIDLIGRSRYRGQRVILVCDGTPPPGGPPPEAGSISVHYAGAGLTADERIARIIRRSSAPRALTIVSSDRAVLRAGRRRRCATLDSAEFLRHLAEDHRRGPAASPPLAPAAPAVLPADLVAEAERLVESEPEPEPPPPAPRAAEEPAADPSAEPAASGEPAGDGAEPGDPATGEPATGDRATGAEEPRPLDLADLDLADLAERAEGGATIPREVLEEAEALWRDASGEEPPERDEPPRGEPGGA